MNLRVHHFLPHSRANGPGTRAVIWVQGCSLGCPSCFNPATHSRRGGELVKVDELADQIVGLSGTIEGVTVSGGEPLQQRAAVTELLRRVKCRTEFSIILFTGFAWDEVTRMGATERRSRGAGEQGRVPGDSDYRIIRTTERTHVPTPSLPEFLNYVDVLLAGRYEMTQRSARGLRGSSNKTVHFLTERYTLDDLESVPVAEVVVTGTGELHLSGIEPVNW